MTSNPLPPQEVWLDERLIVRESRIEGRGLFFAEDLRAGTIVIRLGGTLIASDELDSLIRAADGDPAAPYVDTLANRLRDAVRSGRVRDAVQVRRLPVPRKGYQRGLATARTSAEVRRSLGSSAPRPDPVRS